MNSPRLPAKIGIVCAGLAAAFAIAWFSVEVRQRFTSGPDAQAASGMYAFGDLVLGVAVFGGFALIPLALGLYWLRSVARFWSMLAASALFFAATGFFAVAASALIENSTGGWLLLLAVARIGLMPLAVVAFLVCAVFAPQKRERWLLVAAAAADGFVFAGIVVVKFILPGLHGQ